MFSDSLFVLTQAVKYLADSHLTSILHFRSYINECRMEVELDD
jgi:hypothetical protein